MVAPRKEKIKTLIISGDRSFRNSTIRLFNDIAFPAEKIAVGTVKEARGALQIDPSIGNVCIGGEEHEPSAFKGFLNDLCPYFNGKPIKVLVYLTEKQGTMIAELEKTFPELFFKTLPLKKADFVEAFHSTRLAAQKSGSSPIVKAADSPTKEKPKTEPSQAQDSRTFFETTAHIRDSIDAVNALMSDQTNIQRFLEIGQRFNGIIGTFSFVKHKVGYKQLLELATVLDDLARTYQKHPELTAVSDSHLGLALRSVKCAFALLKHLREMQDPSPEALSEAANIFDAYTKDQKIVRRSSESQSDIDDLLDSFAQRGA